MPNMADMAAHLAVQPSETPRHDTTNLRAPRPSRQHAPTATDAVANTDNADSTSKMSKRLENTHKMHRSAMGPRALAGRAIHRLTT